MNSAVSPSTLAVEWGELLYEISRCFASEQKLEEILAKVLDLILQSIRAYAGGIFLVDQDGYVSKSILVRADRTQEIKVHAIVTFLDRGFAEWVYQQKKADIIKDTKLDARSVELAELPTRARSAMGVPIIRHGSVVGIMIVLHPEPEAFTQRHLLLLEMVAVQAAAAVENAAMYTQANNERQTFQAIISGVRDMILVTDLLGRVILANPAAQQTLSISPAFYAHNLDEIIKEEALVEFYQFALKGGDTDREITLSNGRVYHCTVVNIPEAGWMIGLQDMTVQMQLNALKSEFVSHVSHDLRSPLAVIQGYVWLLDQTPRLNKEARGYLKEIYRLIDRMSELINNLLDLSQIEMGIEADFVDINFFEVVKKVVDNIQSEASIKHVNLVDNIPSGVLSLRGSPLRLSQAVTNLVGNALKFTPPEGVVTVSVLVEGDSVVVSVSDTGPGIPVQMQPLLFQRFSRLSQKSTSHKEGYGLGLAIVKTIVEAHQGKVWVKSQEGKGSTFAFSVPWR